MYSFWDKLIIVFPVWLSCITIFLVFFLFVFCLNFILQHHISFKNIIVASVLSKAFLLLKSRTSCFHKIFKTLIIRILLFQKSRFFLLPQNIMIFLFVEFLKIFDFIKLILIVWKQASSLNLKIVILKKILCWVVKTL